jgi:mRNA interferase RelE/StbE
LRFERGTVMARKERFEYEIQYTKAADKFLRNHEDVRSQYEKAVAELLVGEHPELVDVKRIKGKRNDYFRIRVGDCRVVYAVINGKIVVINTLLAGSRGDVYKKMSGLK